eukprot:11356625-Alexandrium_andersonii.AAC.1
MSASLVGSEMCIRDSVTELGAVVVHPGGPLLPAEVGMPGRLYPVVEQVGPARAAEELDGAQPVHAAAAVVGGP